LPSPLVHGLGSDGQDLYVATSNGIARFDVRMQPRPIDRGDPVLLRWAAGSAATAVAQVGEGGLAITTAYGLIELRRTDRKLVATFTSHRAGAPMKLTAVASVGDEVWLGSETQGAKSMTKHGMRHVQDPEDLPENWVIALAASGSETLWVGTCQHGVARVDLRNPSTHRRFIDTRTILADDMVTALAADERGAFIGTLGGLAFAAAKGESGRAYGWQIGLPDLRSSALLLAGDELWLGTESGLARFRVR
jgi:ligand-binding sensor domain-containing protein